MQLAELVNIFIHASDYIFIMTPWESLLQSNNGSSIIKQLALRHFFKISYISICSKTFLRLCSNKKCKNYI